MEDEEPGFVTAAELREATEAGGAADDGTSTGDTAPDRFAIPERPTRRYPRGGGVEYVGGTRFRLVPPTDRSDRELVALVERVLAGDRYRFGDWFDLPMPLYLVHDDRTHDTYRVSVRDGRVVLHVLPETGSAGLRAFFERLADGEWRVERVLEER
jgi:hypothetical protein